MLLERARSRREPTSRSILIPSSVVSRGAATSEVPALPPHEVALI